MAIHLPIRELSPDDLQKLADILARDHVRTIRARREQEAHDRRDDDQQQDRSA